MRAPAGARCALRITKSHKPAGRSRLGYARNIPHRGRSQYSAAPAARVSFGRRPTDRCKAAAGGKRMTPLAGLKAISTALPLSLIGAFGIASADDDEDFEATLTGDQEVVFDDQENFVPGGTGSAAIGRINADFDAGYTALDVNLGVERLSNAFAAAHFHCGRPGENGPIVFGMVNPGRLAFDGRAVTGRLTNADYTGEDCT